MPEPDRSPPRFRRLVRLPRPGERRLAREVDDELEFHLEMRAAELRAAGLSPEAARQEAERRFGDLTDAREYCRMMDRESSRNERRRDWLADAWDDARWTLRQMTRYPAFTLLAVLTLAVGIGASTAIYSVVHRLLIDPLPLPNGERMVSLVRRSSAFSITPSAQLIAAWREATAFEWVAAIDQRSLVMGEGPDTATLAAGSFETMLPRHLGVRPALGRFFTDDEGTAAASPAAMLGYGLWQRRFGGDPGVIGRSIRLEGVPYTIVGVAPRDFELPFFGSGVTGKEVWTPLVLDTVPGVNGIALLRPGVTPEQASREMTALMAGVADPSFTTRFEAAAVRPQDFLGKATRDTLVVTMGAVAVLLLIACTNVANLLLARSIGRERELAVRSAIGAARGRLVRQLLTESALLSLLGGALGLLVAWRGLDAIVALRPDNLMALDRVRLEGGVVAGALGVAVLTGLLFGLAPAIFATGGSIGQALRQGALSASGHRRSTRLRSAFVTVEIALSVVLLVGAGLMVRSFVQMQRTDLGIDPRGLMSVHVTLPGERYATTEHRWAVIDEIRQRLVTIPGVEDTEVAVGLPAAAGATFGTLEIEGTPLDPGAAATVFGYNAVRSSFFRFVGLRLREGRTVADDPMARGTVINASMAARYWPGQSAVGKRFRLSKEGAWSTVVGVVDDVRLPGGRGSIAEHQLYVPFREFFTESGMGDRESASGPAGRDAEAALLLRVAEGTTDVLQRVSAAVGSIDPSITVVRLETMRRLIEARYVRPRFAMALLGAFAVVALVVASVGLYGVIAFAVSRRSREMGIRLALGAQPRSVLRLVLGEGARLGLLGMSIGLVGAAAGTRLMQGLIYGISPLDPFTFGLVAAMLMVVSLLASYGPARRAVRADPLAALRSD